MQDRRLNRPIFKSLELILVLVGIFAYLSTRPAYRLRADMPPDYMDAPAFWPSEKLAAEQKVARAYWYCVVTAIGPEYNFGESLPVNPPTEFKIDMPDLAKGATDPDTRLHYWRRLQKLWFETSTWRIEREWNYQWLTRLVKASTRWLHD